MEFPSVHLPPSVEANIQKICHNQHLSSPNHEARQALSSLDESSALSLLDNLSVQRIRNFSAYIIYSAKKMNTASPAKGSPAPAPRQTQGEGVSILHALHNLEFRKLFMVLSYLGRNKVEHVLTIEMVQNLKDSDMLRFESMLYEIVKNARLDCIGEIDRRQNLDWKSNSTHVYYCDVHSDGNAKLKGPYLNRTRTHLQRVLGDDNVLNVRFVEEVTDRSTHLLNSYYASFLKLVEDGIRIGLRRYRFFVFKDGGKEAKKKNPTSSPVKCYFVCMESAMTEVEKPSVLIGKTVREARSMFMHIHTVTNMAKYMARFSLILSKTVKLEIDLDFVNVVPIDDIPCLDANGRKVYNNDEEVLIHTDGTGFISEDLAMKCRNDIYKGDYLHDHEKTLRQAELERKYLIVEPPLLLQCRLFHNGLAVKGTLLLNKRLPENTIQIRPSMIKVENDPKFSHTRSINSLEIVTTSNRPRRTCLSKYLIALLNYGGVSEEYFLDLAKHSLADSRTVCSNLRAALKVALMHGDMDDFLASRMISSGIPLDEPYLKNHLSFLMREEHKSVKEGKIPLSDCYYLMGTADPTGMLKANEVCVVLENGQMSGELLLFKHPGIHFGDIHVVTATYVPRLESYIGDAKYAIFFPTQRPRSLADEMANGDFDGDMYWVSRNPQLLQKFNASEPWERISSKQKLNLPSPTELSEDQLEVVLFKQFLRSRFQSSSIIGTAADSWLAFMDRLLTLGDECSLEKQHLKEKIIKLIEIYYDALDSSKYGLKVEIPKELKAEKFPHYLGRGDSHSYTSTSVLGKIYDMVDSYKLENSSSEEIQQLPCFSGEVPEACLSKWKRYYSMYCTDMSQALSDSESKDNAAKRVYMKYKQILYGAAEFSESPRRPEEIFDEAVAIYQVCYNSAKEAQRNIGKGIGKCGFAWKVAGDALLTYYAERVTPGERFIPCSASVLRQLLG